MSVIQEVRIYDENMNLKKIIPKERVLKRYWEQFFNPHKPTNCTEEEDNGREHRVKGTE